MTTEFIIRPPEDSERDRFYEVYNTGLPGVDEISKDRFDKWWDRSRQSGNIEKLWRVAVLENEIVAVVINLVNSELNWGFVWELAVIPEQRGQGIGSRLIEHSEILLVEHSPHISHLAIGVKTDNIKALRLYEKHNYGIYFLLIHLRGPKWAPPPQSVYTQKRADLSMVDKLIELVPDAYWGNRNREAWIELLKDETYVIMDDNEKIIGFVRLVPPEGTSEVTEIPFSFLKGHGIAVLDTYMNSVQTAMIDLWIQNTHQDILEVLYERGFRRLESEFLLRKRVT